VIFQFLLFVFFKTEGRNKIENAPYRPRDAMRANDARSTAKDEHMKDDI